MGNGSRAVALVATAVVACSSAEKGSSPPPPPPIVPPPAISSVEPPFMVPGYSVRFYVNGYYLAASAQSSPTLKVTRVRDLEGNPVGGPELSATVAVASAGDRQQVFIEPGDAPAGVYDAEVQNEKGVARYPDAFAMLPAPLITSLDSDVMCTPQDVLGIEGVFYKSYGDSIDVLFTTSERTHRLAITALSGCAAIPFRVPFSLCTRIEARFLSPPSTPIGELTVALVQVPAFPALSRRLVVEEKDATLYDALGLFSAVEAPVSVRIWSGTTVVGGGVQPSATLDGAPVSLRATGCTPAGEAWTEYCSGLDATVPQGTAPGEHVVEVTTAAGCSRAHTLTLAPRPVITSLVPAQFCTRAPQSVRVYGDGFVQPWLVVDGGVPFGAVECASGGSQPTCMSFDGAGDLPIGAHEISIANASVPMVRSSPATLTVTPGPPWLGQPSPRAVYAGATRSIFVPALFVTGRLVSAALVPYPGGGPPVPVDVAPVAGGADITFPALGESGSYLVEIADESPCIGSTSRYPHYFTAFADAAVRHWDFETEDLVYAVSETPGSAPRAEVLTGDGNPGNAMGASRGSAGPDWYFFLDTTWEDADLAALRFDLRVSGSGEPSAAPAIVIASGTSPRLEYGLPRPPAGLWTHFDVPLDSPTGWTFRDASGARDATMADLRGRLQGFWILGSWWMGPGAAAIDNVAIELAR